jgi:hypothetical protein
MSSNLIDPDVLQVILERGFRVRLSDTLNKEYVDEDGCVLSELMLMGQTVESVTEVIDVLHELPSDPEPDDDVA